MSRRGLTYKFISKANEQCAWHKFISKANEQSAWHLFVMMRDLGIIDTYEVSTCVRSVLVRMASREV